MHRQHLGNICLKPRSLERVLLPLRHQVIDSVLQLVMILAVVGGDGLPYNITNCSLVSGSES
jgi:hypothetical protein